MQFEKVSYQMQESEIEVMEAGVEEYEEEIVITELQDVEEEVEVRFESLRGCHFARTHARHALLLVLIREMRAGAACGELVEDQAQAPASVRTQRGCARCLHVPECVKQGLGLVCKQVCKLLGPLHTSTTSTQGVH